jgi:exopolyphosphatase / guanosine-5'-triphosphate,3'-diphosphate pyrophosphatase
MTMHPPVPGPKDVAAALQVAVVDCGTSSVRAFIAQLPTDGGDPEILEDLSFPVDLTDAFVSGKLSRQAMDGVVEAFVNIVASARGYGITTVRAVGTSALREAINSDVLVERLRANQGIDLEIIDNAEEARLYSEALRLVLERTKRELPGRTLMIDLGGGSTCIGLITNGKLVHSVDEHYGSVRILEQFHSLRDSGEFALTIDRYALGAARMMLDRLPKGQINHLVITSGDVRKLCSLLTKTTAKTAKGGIQPLAVKDVASWYHKMQAMTPLERANACVSDARGAALLLPAASLLKHLSAETGAHEVLVPYLTLRDGLIADLMPGAHGAHYLSAADLMAEGMQLVARYGGNLAYAENTGSLATQIFDQTASLHGLGERERALLEFSALVHDIGSYINVRNRHKHSMYVIQSSDIAGLTAIEKEMVANIARYHRKSPPEAHHLEFRSLPRAKRVVVSYLAAILRLAYGLDVERTQRIKKVRCEVSDGRLLIHVDRRQIALERWSLSGKAGMFAEVFGLEVAVVAREEK